MIEVKKSEIYKRLLITSAIAHIGGSLNYLVVKANNVWMPVNYPKESIKLWFLSDIFPLPFTNMFFSIGDVVLLGALIYFVYSFVNLLRRDKKSKELKGGKIKNVKN